MTRRSITLSVAGALVVALLAIASLFPVPYVVYTPGWLENTLAEKDGSPVVQVADEDVPTYDTDGQLDLTTVAVTSADTELDLLTVLHAWFDDERAVVPRNVVYREDETAEESREQSARQLARSQEAAKVAALRHLDYEVSEELVVAVVFDGMPADGVLEPGDVIVEVDGMTVDEPEEVAEIVEDREPGDTVDLAIRRDGEERSVTAETVPAEDDGRPVVGFAPDRGYELPFEVSIGIDERIGGPSAGVVFALAIYDRLTEEPLIDGNHVAGSGEISGDGEIGSVGGLQQKIAAASNAGAELFLAPRGNCAEATEANSGDMRIVPVDTLTDAIEAVDAFTDDPNVQLPACQ
ncbi:PDZ domain-containing protein [Actinobacteria bacterium YIM 96077]|uniref:PDZ/DHR/GLGF domain-containing protein n=1 Tax=Phytoactinopolyspora halophila TaxID=1981511 RepID=A0A329R5U1_9ACTN|nr:PDZ domain-containing protein [Phytoactinopolyspora halophila]AYY11964.1 PDZ domain-containing protein [Actinobacteria bacterium YIM 96077]RAW18802.1 PDZ/DHR/GLGF domain-containing protein [Phytoactinopolyspora halophila]